MARQKSDDDAEGLGRHAANPKDGRSLRILATRHVQDTDTSTVSSVGINGPMEVCLSGPKSMCGKWVSKKGRVPA